MNGLERYMAVVRDGGEPDCLPRLPILMQFAAEHIGSNYGAFASDHRVLAQANLRCAAEFDFDQVSTISDPYRETQGYGAEIEYVRDGVPRCLGAPLEHAKDLALLKRPDPNVSERMADRVEAVRALKREVGATHSILGWVEGPAAEGADLRGVTNFLIDSIDDEPFLADLMDLCVDVATDFARAQIAAGADTIGIGDAIASQVSPDFYERMIEPRQKRIVEAIHAMGALARLHICGNITHLLPGIAGLGLDVLDVDHMVAMGAVREAVGTKVALCGNIDPVDGVLNGSPDSIRAAVRATYAEVGAPYLVGAGCEIPPGTPPENLKALCEPISVSSAP
jgi:MtaA/CmuA family methyltransferase